MEMNAKLILLGGIAWYATAWVVSMATASFIHEGVLADDYLATAAFWRPELMQDPPDMAALMPRWLATGLMSAAGCVRPSPGPAGSRASSSGWSR
jgi:hypothetical protein